MLKLNLLISNNEPISYKVSKNKLNKSGLKLNGKISKDIKNTLELIKYI